MTIQIDEKRQAWHTHLTKCGKRPEDAAGTLRGKKKQQKIAPNKQSLRRIGLD